MSILTRWDVHQPLYENKPKEMTEDGTINDFFSDMQGVPSTIKALSIFILLYSIRLFFYR